MASPSFAIQLRPWDLEQCLHPPFKVLSCFRAFCVFRCLHKRLPLDQNLITRRFIVLARKLRDDVRKALSTSHRDLQKLTDAVSETAEATKEYKHDPLPIPLPVTAELQIPEADKREQRTQHHESHTLQKWLTVGTWPAFVAAGVYAGIDAWQTYEIRRNFRRDQRAMMKVTSEAPDMEANPVSYPVHLSNVGKTPALNIRAEFQFQFSQAR